MPLLKADQTRGYSVTPRGLENMFVSLFACVFAVIVSEAKTLMSALRYASLIHSSYFSFSSSPSALCVRDKPLPSGPSRENITALTMTLSYPFTCMLVLRLQRETPKAKQTVFCLHLSPSICDHQADRGVCCCCNRPIVLCLGSQSYLHYMFYKQTNILRHISGEDEGSLCVFIFVDYFVVYVRLETHVRK